MVDDHSRMASSEFLAKERGVAFLRADCETEGAHTQVILPLAGTDPLMAGLV